MASGRPTTYTDELADKVCDAVASTDEGLDHICAAHDWMPDQSTVYLWRTKHPIFSEKYLKAKALQGEIFAEGTLRIAKQKATYFDGEGNERVDPGHVAWQKLNVNTRQWHASKLAPKIYGDQKQIEELKSKNESMDSEIRALRAELDAKNRKDY
jgi:predicted RNase H-like nuclease (RuvC/YqgF family)